MIGVDLDPLRLDVVEEFLLTHTWMTLGRVLDAEPNPLINLTQIRNHPLTRPTPRSIRLHQRPVSVTFAVLLSIALSQIHTAILENLRPPATG